MQDLDPLPFQDPRKTQERQDIEASLTSQGEDVDPLELELGLDPVGDAARRADPDLEAPARKGRRNRGREALRPTDAFADPVDEDEYAGSQRVPSIDPFSGCQSEPRTATA